MAFSFVQENTASRQRLDALVARLSDADLARVTPFGWTVAALLAHLAFWDQRVFVLLRRWKVHGVDPSPIDADAVNEALRPLCLVLVPRSTVALCLSSAKAVDAEIETVGADLVEAIHALAGTQFRLSRAIHRNGHLDDIELLLRTRRDQETG